jgi:hypothetical protein
MNRTAIIALVSASCGLVACNDMRSSPPPTRSATNQTYGGTNAQQYSSGTDNSMSGTQGGFNNDDINGKSRNAYSTTPGTGPMNANPVASGNTPR